MNVNLPALLRLWAEPASEESMHAGFARWYADPVRVNGTPVRVTDLVARAQALQRGLADMRHEIVEHVEQGDKVVFAFVLHGLHRGRLATPLGEVPATGRAVAVRGMDVLTFTDGRISDITVVVDELGLVTQVGALPALRGQTTGPSQDQCGSVSPAGTSSGESG